MARLRLSSLLLLVPVLFVAVPASAGEMVKALRATTGDTIVVERGGKEETIRLLGIVTPDPTNKKIEVSKFGEWARVALGGIIQNQYVMIESDPKAPPTDEQGARLAYVWKGGDKSSVNERMLLEGFGIVYKKIPFSFVEKYEGDVSKAKSWRKGLWGPDAEKASQQAGKRAQPEYFGQLGGTTGQGGGGGAAWVEVWIISFW